MANVKQNSFTKNDDFPVVSLVVMFFMALAGLLAGKKLLGDDFPVVMRWWLGMNFWSMRSMFPIPTVHRENSSKIDCRKA